MDIISSFLHSVCTSETMLIAIKINHLPCACLVPIDNRKMIIKSIAHYYIICRVHRHALFGLFRRGCARDVPQDVVDRVTDVLEDNRLLSLAVDDAQLLPVTSENRFVQLDEALDALLDLVKVAILPLGGGDDPRQDPVSHHRVPDAQVQDEIWRPDVLVEVLALLLFPGESAQQEAARGVQAAQHPRLDELHQDIRGHQSALRHEVCHSDGLSTAGGHFFP